MRGSTSTEVDGWIAGSLAGSESDWMRLLGQTWELVDQIVRRSRSMGQLKGRIDDHREVVSRVFARLRRNEYRALRLFGTWLERHPEKSFEDWLTIVSTNVIRDYLGERLGGLDESGAGLKRLVNTLAASLDVCDDAGARPPITNALDAATLFDTAKAILPEDQYAALASWLQGCEFEDIAKLQGLQDSAAARAKVRAALARLRRDVRDREDS